MATRTNIPKKKSFLSMTLMDVVHAIGRAISGRRAHDTQKFTARVVWINDGDTVQVRQGTVDTRDKIRLAGIDAPETAQPYGEKSAQHLKKLVAGKAVEIEAIETDAYERIVSRVTVGGKDVALEMLEAGMAWPCVGRFRNLGPIDRAAYSAAAGRAKASRAGLWADPAPQAPWNWRKRHRATENELVKWLRKTFPRLPV